MSTWAHLKDYLGRLSKKWILWLFLMGDSVGILAGAIDPSIKLPVPIYWAVAMTGLLWAGFQVHKDLLSQLPQTDKPQPDLAIELMEGNEYSYAISETPVAAKDAVNAHITLHARMTNTGNTDLILLSMKTEFQPFEGPWSVEEGQPFRGQEPLLTRPLALKPGEVLYCDLESEIRPDPANQLSFAARLASANTSSTPMLVRLRVETVDPLGDITDFWGDLEVATRPMRELYLQSWRLNNRAELLKLAKVGNSKQLEDISNLAGGEHVALRQPIDQAGKDSNK